ncbi:TetR/AcrR family transcriptional regulator [Embleya sp. MST-111070]|uniref:TetR/AcrR family transcriptional regulator n=1 Tax=Embleya sp. MST-111070 TaxID=3398231 RepID=UPI003F735FB1
MARQQLTPLDWSTAALRALARGGVAAVSVNALAGELQATRGSFYWHFKDRNALLTAALEMWERDGTTTLISQIRNITDPLQRLRALFTIALGPEEISGLGPAIVAHADHPAVAPILQRVTRRRIAYLTELYTDVGLEPVPARRQAVALYATYLGWLELRRASGDTVPEVAATGAQAVAALEHLFTEIALPESLKPPGRATSPRRQSPRTQ